MKPLRTLAHLSDLHLGAGSRTHVMAQRATGDLLRRGVDHVVVTGDLTHRGRKEEYEAFLEVFAPLVARGRVTIVPGNHDRPGDDVARWMMDGRRVHVEQHPGLYLVKLDSTGPHNRLLWQGHGLVTPGDLQALDVALAQAPQDALVVVLMHHHPYPLPEEGTLEWLSAVAGLPYAAELHCGSALLNVVTHRVDLLLHGHRHVPSERYIACGRQGLTLFNAGSSTALGRFRIIEHQAGRIVRHGWHTFMRQPSERSWLEHVIPAMTG